jgi:hypothetical protein
MSTFGYLTTRLRNTGLWVDLSNLSGEEMRIPS